MTPSRRTTDRLAIQSSQLTAWAVGTRSIWEMSAKSTPFGSVESPVNPIMAAIMNGATFVARSFSGHGEHLIELMQQAIQHRGFALIDIFSPCVTYNHDNDYPFFRERIKRSGLSSG